MIPIAKPIIDEDEISAVTVVLRSGIIAQGRKVSMNNVNIIGSGRLGTPAAVGFDQLHNKETFHREIKPHDAS